MKKKEALVLAKVKFDTSFTASNTHFSKINKAKPVWWLEIPISKINNGALTIINLLLEDEHCLQWLKLDTAFLKQNLQGFKIREGKAVICLELDIHSFKNTVGPAKLSFKPFMQ